MQFQEAQAIPCLSWTMIYSSRICRTEVVLIACPERIMSVADLKGRQLKLSIVKSLAHLYASRAGRLLGRTLLTRAALARSCQSRRPKMRLKVGPKTPCTPSSFSLRAISVQAHQLAGTINHRQIEILSRQTLSGIISFTIDCVPKEFYSTGRHCGPRYNRAQASLIYLINRSIPE